MTEQEIEKIQFKFRTHLSLEHKHCSTYKGILKGHSLMMCVHTPYRNGSPCGKAYTHYMLDGVVYKSKEKIIEALKQIEV